MANKERITDGYVKRVAFRLSHDPIVFCHWCGEPTWGSDTVKKMVTEILTRWHPMCYVAVSKNIHP